MQVFRFLELIGPERTLIKVPERTVHFALRPPSFGQYLHESSRALSIRLITRTIGEAIAHRLHWTTQRNLWLVRRFCSVNILIPWKKSKKFFSSLIWQIVFFSLFFFLVFLSSENPRCRLDVAFFLYFPLCRDFVGIICRHFSTVYLSFIIVHVNSRGCCVLRLSLTRYIIIILWVKYRIFHFLDGYWSVRVCR